MSSLNYAQIIGNLTKDPELKQTQGGTFVANISVATNSSWTDKQGVKHEEAEFHNITAWGKLAEICGQYLKKGAKAYFAGALKTQSWDDKQTGKKMYRTEIVCRDMIMLGSKPPQDENPDT
jgi:single-strand DNA-binding protein